MFSIFASTNGIWITVFSVGGAGLVLVLAYVAQALVKNGDFEGSIRRMAYLNSHEVKATVKFSSTNKRSREFSDIYLGARINGKIVRVTGLAAMPLSNADKNDFLLKSGKGYGLVVTPNSKIEAILDFEIPEEDDIRKFEETFICATNERGKKIKASFELASTKTQTINFKKF